MAKSVSEINREFVSSWLIENANRENEKVDEVIPVAGQNTAEEIAILQESNEPRSKMPPAKRSMIWILDTAFYLAIAFILIATLCFSSQNNTLRVLGYSSFAVVSDSMQSSIPKGSLVITKETDPKEIVEGNIITFLTASQRSITHRVVSISEDYAGSGQRGFTTKGDDNFAEDNDIVFAANVIGVVIYSVPELGSIFSYFADNIGLLFLLLGGTSLSVTLIARLIKSSHEDRKQRSLPDGKIIVRQTQSFSFN